MMLIIFITKLMIGRRRQRSSLCSCQGFTLIRQSLTSAHQSGDEDDDDDDDDDYDDDGYDDGDDDGDNGFFSAKHQPFCLLSNMPIHISYPRCLIFQFN